MDRSIFRFKTTAAVFANKADGEALAMSDAKALYEEDFLAWSKQQAEALRAVARGRTNQPIDWANLAEEIEDLGKSERRELASRLSIIVEHLAKLDHSRARDPRNKWRQTIRRERAAIDRILEDSPSLRREVPLLIEKEKKRTIDIVLAELSARGEVSRSERGVSKGKSAGDLFSYSAEQIVGDWFPPDPGQPPSAE